MEQTPNYLSILIINADADIFEILVKTSVFIFITWIVVEIIFSYIKSAQLKVDEIYDYWKADFTGRAAKNAFSVFNYSLYAACVTLIYQQCFYLFNNTKVTIEELSFTEVSLTFTFFLVGFLIITINKINFRVGEYK